MKIYVNERPVEVKEGEKIASVRDRVNPSADLLILNGFPADELEELSAGDRLSLIERGVVPPVEEIEAMIGARHTPGLRERLKGARVGVAGVGGLGSNVAIALTRVGVGTLVLADFDVVEPSNLGRQQFFMDQIGMEKTSALAETLARAHPGVALELYPVRVTPDNIHEIFGGCSVVVEAFDRAEEKTMLVEVLLKEMPEVTIVAASGVAGSYSTEGLKIHRVGERFYVVGDLESEARPFQGLMAPRVGAAGHIQANLVLRILLGEL
ncbi:MAG: thiamine biosynthesis protein ThiF [Deltaproteobacteria bacterium]|nr:MAG: thiamine biosynthesis protein ThiF [Deltaproteobacteria bacterium]